MALKDRFRRAVTRSNTTPHESSGKSISPSSSKTASGATTPTNNHPAPDGLSPLTSTQTAVDTKSPVISLTKTHSLLGKTMTWGGSSSNGEAKKSKEEKEKEKQLNKWKKEDEVEWTSPMKQRPGRKDAGCQNTLRAFDFRTAALEGNGERNKSICSGVSPSGSRNGSIDEPLTLAQINGKRNSGASVDHSKLSQELSRLEVTDDAEKKPKQSLAGVQE